MRRNAIIFIVLATVMAAALYAFGPARLYAALQTNGASVSGVIVEIRCKKSTEFVYSFTAQGRSYTGTGVSIEQCSQFKQGASVPVVYLVTDPTQNFSGDPARAFDNYVFATILASILLPGGVTIALHLRRKNV